MINALVSFVMNVVGIIITGLLGPLVLLFNNLFPDTTTYFDYILDFLGQALNYISFILSLLGFTSEMTALLFSFFSLQILVFVGFIGFRFAINLYDKLKP